MGIDMTLSKNNIPFGVVNEFQSTIEQSVTCFTVFISGAHIHKEVSQAGPIFEIPTFFIKAGFPHSGKQNRQ